jgi:hypothetical protein
MTIGLAWVGKRADGREHLYMASDSRVGGLRLDFCPKILTLPRSDSALCFAGHTHAAFPLMLQVAYAIAAHEPARERNLDISRVKDHLLRVFTDLIPRIKESPRPFATEDAQFIFAGYSGQRKDFCIWTINYLEKEKRFAARESFNFLPRIRKAAFIGDASKKVRSAIAKELSGEGTNVYLQPLRILSGFLRDSTRLDSIGGPPQVIRITQDMNTRSFCVRWNDEDTLFGRPLFDYENTDYWTIDPFSGKFERPRKFGYRKTREERPSGSEVDDDEPDEPQSVD